MKKVVIWSLLFMLVALAACNPTVLEEPETQAPTMTPAPFSSLTPPWTDAEVFYDETTTINVELWDKFIIGYDYHGNLFAMFDVTYDRYPNSVNLLEEARESTSEPSEPPGINGVKWFLFQAIKEGDTQVTIKELTHQSDAVQSQKTFNIHVGQP
jgi:predicted secreted protein